jgi:histidinol-phosphatase
VTTAERDLGGELAFALELADAADAITLPRYEQRDFTVDWKVGLDAARSEVTEVDRAAEQAISRRVLAERPTDGLLGEEHGLAGEAASPWRWIVDPIDGTSNFVRGIPVLATLVALTHVELGAVVGVVSAPAIGRRWWAARGLGAHVDHGRGARPLHVSATPSLSLAQVSVTFSPGWDALGLTDRLVRLQQDAHRARGFGDFWQHMLVAEGALDAAVDAVGVCAYDLAAVMAIVEEAGGTFTDRVGERTFEHDTAISSNGALHADVVGRLREPEQTPTG